MVAHDSGYKRSCHVLQYGSLYRMVVFMLKAQARWWVGSQVIITTTIIIIIIIIIITIIIIYIYIAQTSI